jgi:hypothetical protein
MTILFLHGWHSVPGGIKPTYLREHGHTVINPALDDEDFGVALRTAQAEFDTHQPQVVVGSSRGGAVAMNINSGNAMLVLLCPAWKRWGTATSVKPGTVILHSRAVGIMELCRAVLFLLPWYSLHIQRRQLLPGTHSATKLLPRLRGGNSI